MATYATYRHVELDRVGVGKKRVLKPPGGGSSIVFDEDESMKPVKSRPQQEQQQQQQQSPPPQASPEPPKEAPPAEKQPEQPFPKPESNGMSTPDCSKEDAASSRDSNPSPAATTNGERSPALNGPPAVNGSSTTNGTLSSGTSSSMSMHSGGTPKHLNTQTRIFGNEQGAPTPRRRLRDHERSNIFAGDDASSNGTHRPVFRRPRTRRDPVTGVGVLCWDLHAPRCAPSKWKADVNGSSRNSDSTPEPKTPEQPQQGPRQRVPPGGFSTKLW